MPRRRRKKNWMSAGRDYVNRQGAAQRERVWDRVMGPRKKTKGVRGAGAASGLRAEVAEALIGQGYKKSEAQKMAGRASGSDFDSLFRSAMARNPARVFPGSLTKTERTALQKLARLKGKKNPFFSELSELQNLVGLGKGMSKKAKRKKKRNPRKGVMPAGLKKYWAKKRAAKNRRRSVAKQTRRRKPNARRRKRNIYFDTHSLGFKWGKKPRRRKRRAKRNPARKAHPLRLKVPAGMTAQRYAKLVRPVLRGTGIPVRVVKK
jgi:hypothetical protein